MKPNSNLMEL
nr:unnamed protein product [Callosobruchus analis]